VQGFERFPCLPDRGMSQRLTLLFGDRVERVPATHQRDHEIGDELDVEGRRWEVIGILWLEDEERLLCRPLKDSDLPVMRERAWWSTEWR
jgi:hypothetical protein